jgi:Cu-Zn family superoxide dismutase
LQKYLDETADLTACVAASFRRNLNSSSQGAPPATAAIKAWKKELEVIVGVFSPGTEPEPAARPVNKCAELTDLSGGESGSNVQLAPARHEGQKMSKEKEEKEETEQAPGTAVYARCVMEPCTPGARCSGVVVFRQSVQMKGRNDFGQDPGQNAGQDPGQNAGQDPGQDSRQDLGGQVEVQYVFGGLSPGLHGFHIHESACGALSSAPHDCGAAGGHWNPHGAAHGDVTDAPHCHAGDLGNVAADATGRAQGSLRASLVHLFGPYTVVGRSVVIHQDPDDLGRGDSSEPGVNGKTSKTTGNSGARVACGSIAPCTAQQARALLLLHSFAGPAPIATGPAPIATGPAPKGADIGPAPTGADIGPAPTGADIGPTPTGAAAQD